MALSAAHWPRAVDPEAKEGIRAQAARSTTGGTILNWINKLLGVKTPEPPQINATDEYVIVNRHELDKLIGELNNHYERNAVIEEVVAHLAKMKGFGQDTLDSLSIYIRELKR